MVVRMERGDWVWQKVEEGWSELWGDETEPLRDWMARAAVPDVAQAQAYEAGRYGMMYLKVVDAATQADSRLASTVYDGPEAKEKARAAGSGGSRLTKGGKDYS